MQLKHIKLAGFKSFVDPTRISFPTNMVAVVGPNGCGKSNVIDAVRWVLGELSAKNLRGESMSDVIFNGSDLRQPSGQCSIELLFDNSLGKLGGEYSKYNEISVKRLIEREGKSNYSINNISCRRKDVQDIFLGTGLGPKSYAIIEQGMISRLIEAKPEELRVFIEEAAGILKFKSRKNDAVRKLDSSRQNLERVADIVQELHRQVESLKRQAAKAERYKNFKAEIKELSLQLFAVKIKRFQVQLKTIEQELEEQMQQRLTEELDAYIQEIVEKVDNYLNYVSEEWVKDNQLAIEKGIRSELTEGFLVGLKDLFTEHYITIPDEKVDVVDDLFDKVESLESELNEQVSKNVDIQSELTKVKKEKVLSSLTKDLTETQKEKVAELAENVEAEDAEDFEQKVEVLKENYFPTEDKKVALVEDIETQNNDEESEKEAVPAGMEHYMSAISRHVR